MISQGRTPSPLPLHSLITKQLLGVVGSCLHGCHSAGELRGLGIEEQGQQLRVQVQRPQQRQAKKSSMTRVMWMLCCYARRFEESLGWVWESYHANREKKHAWHDMNSCKPVTTWSSGEPLEALAEIPVQHQTFSDSELNSFLHSIRSSWIILFDSAQLLSR